MVCLGAMALLYTRRSVAAIEWQEAEQSGNKEWRKADS